VIASRRRIAVRLTGIAAFLALVAGCSAGVTPSATGGSVPPLDSAVSDIPHRSVAPMPAARLAKNLIPPTNQWFSGLVFGSTPQPVFPLPLSFGLTNSGFAFGVPTVTTSADTIAGGFLPAINVDNGSASSTITHYDSASVTIEQRARDGQPIGSVVIAEGSPVVSYTALRDGEVTLATPFDGSGRVRVATAASSRYGLVTTGAVTGTHLQLAKGQTAALFAIPAGADPVQFASHVSILTGVSMTYAVGATQVTTSLHYQSRGTALVAAMPHQIAGLQNPSSCSLGSYPSIYGTLELCAGSDLSWTSPKNEPETTLDLSTLTGSEKNELQTQLATDIRATKALPPDSYFGGKALFRLANILMLAHQLNDTTAAADAQTKLDPGLVKWADPKGCSTRATECFVYDTAVKGVVGLKASFGSEQFNDHAFHYGYFLYAAGIAARYEPSLTRRIQPVIDLLAADIGTGSKSTNFPTRRVFDAYAGHSWASGYAPFADGNNQESSSEAINAWNGLALWGTATGNQQLTTEATWMLSAEASSAKAYWTNFPRTAAVYSGYQHSVVGINWSGKRDYATWFSADANAKLGIQLIPMSPISTYLAGDPNRIAENITAAAPAGYAVQFGDYMLMYSALESGRQASEALGSARSLPARFIDDANSRSYLLAWIMSRTK
jgi:endo-1,3(4)-beta-glucanase